jgi:hypothetical protein
MSYWLLTLREQSGGMEHHTKHLVEASDRQQVKYEYHRAVERDYNVQTDPNDKHRLVDYDRGYSVNIESIESLSDAEYAVMSGYLNDWN